MTQPKASLPPDVQNDLDDLLNEFIPPPLETNDITVKRIIDRKISSRKAMLIIQTLVESKRIIYLGKRRTRNGILVDAWRKA